MNVIDELSDIPVIPDEESDEISPGVKQETNETEMKNALKKLMDLQNKKHKTNQLVSELGKEKLDWTKLDFITSDDIKSILHLELQNMANTEVSAFRSAAIKKLEKIKNILKNKTN